jgi:hypothetical protein
MSSSWDPTQQKLQENTYILEEVQLFQTHANKWDNLRESYANRTECTPYEESF